MELRNLNTFKTILETGSFRAAAKRLNYTQSTVTFQVQQLEQELSVKLFERIGRKMALTQAGRDLVPHVETVLRFVQQLTDYGKAAGETTGVLRIAVAETLLAYQLQPVLSRFRREAPRVELSVQVLNCCDIREQTISGGVDIGIRYDLGEQDSSIVSQRLGDFPLVLIASPLLSEGLSDFITPRQRKPVCLITNDRASIFHEIFDDYLKERGIVLNETMELGSIEAIKSCVASDLGVAYLPRHVVHGEIAAGTLKALNVRVARDTITGVAAYHKNKWIGPAMMLFLKLLSENQWYGA